MRNLHGRMTRRGALMALGFAATGRGAIQTYVIAEPCIGTKDTACVDVCPVDCIHPRRDEADFRKEPQLYIDPAECVYCGACVKVCPVSAVFSSSELPEKWASYARKNAEYYRSRKKPAE